MIATWYTLVALAFVAYAVFDGRNLGIVLQLRGLGTTPDERRAVMSLLQPLWSWDEVWLVVAFGTLFLAFPKVLATGLAGYYLAVFLLLWCLILRGVAFEMGAHLGDELWRRFFETLLVVSSTLLAFFFGAAFGNVVRGVPLGADGRMFLPFFTDFSASGRVGIFDWYTTLVGALTVALLAAHGATFVALRSTGELAARARRAARRAWMIAAPLLLIVSLGTHWARPDFFSGLVHRVAGWIALLMIAGGLVAVYSGLRGGMDSIAWRGSCATIIGLLGGAAASIYPVMLRSTVAPVYSLTAQEGATGRYGLTVALVWWPIAAGLGFWYYWLVAKRYTERIGSADAG